MENTNENPQRAKPTLSERFIFGLGSAFFLGLFIGGTITDKIIKPDLNNPVIAEKWLGFFFVIFFLIGFIFPQIFTTYFTGLLRGRVRGGEVSDAELQSKTSPWWAIYFVTLFVGCFFLLFTRFTDLVPVVFIVGFIVLIFGNKKKGGNIKPPDQTGGFMS